MRRHRSSRRQDRRSNISGLHTLGDLIEQTKTDPNEDYPNHDLSRFELSASIDPTSQEFKELEALRAFVIGEGGLAAALDRH